MRTDACVAGSSAICGVAAVNQPAGAAAADPVAPAGLSRAHDSGPRATCQRIENRTTPYTGYSISQVGKAG